MNHKIFVGRENELEFFRSTMKKLVNNKTDERPFSNTILIYGVGGMGKSSLCSKFIDIANTEYPDVIQISIDWDRYKHGCTFSPSELLDIICDAIPNNFSKDLKPYLDAKKDLKNFAEEINRQVEESSKFANTIGKAAPTVTTAFGGNPEIGMAISAGVNVVEKTVQQLYKKYLKDKRGISSEQLLLYQFPELVLAERLRESINSIIHKMHMRFLLLFDTCELIRQSEEWFVDNFVVPFVDGNKHSIIIYSGRDNIRDDRIATVDAKAASIRGIANKLSFHEPYCIDMKLFSIVDIDNYIGQQFEIGVSEEVINFVQTFSRGVPYAVELLVNALHRLGTDSTIRDFKSDHFQKQLKQSSSNEGIIKTVAERFIIYCFHSEDNRADLFKIYTIAILRDCNPIILREIWHVEDPAETLRMLAGKYTFFIGIEKLHDVVQEFLIEHILRTQLLREGDAKNIAILAFPLYQNIYQNICDKVPEWEQRPREPQWKNAVLNLLNVLSWKDPSEAANYFIKIGIELLLFDCSLISTLKIPLDKFIRMDGLIWGRQRQQIDELMEAAKAFKWYSFSDKVLSFCNKALMEWKLDPSHMAIIHIIKGRMLYNQKDYDGALKVLLKDYDNTILNVAVRNKLASALDDVGGRFCLHKNNYYVFSKKALIAFESVVELNDRSSSYLYHLAVMLRQSGQPEKALPYYSKSLDINSKSEYVWFSQGKALYDLGRIEDSIVSHQKAIKFNPKYISPYRSLANIYLDLGQYDDAIAIYDRFIEISPKNNSVYCYLGNIYVTLGQYDDAGISFNKAIEISPSDTDAQLALAFAYFDLDKLTEAEYILDKVKESDPESPWLFNGLGVLQNCRGNYKEAIEYFEKAIALETEDIGPLYNNMGDSYMNLKQYEKSIEIYDKAIANNSRYAYSRLGYVYLIIGEYGRAVDSLLKAINSQKNSTVPLINLAIAYMCLGKFEEAEHHFNEVIRLCINLKAIPDLLNNVVAHTGLRTYDKAVAILNNIKELYGISSITATDLIMDLELLAKASNPDKELDHFLVQAKSIIENK